MNTSAAEVVEIAREYYNSDDADNFYFHVWGGEDIHIGLYEHPDEDIATASRRTVTHMADRLPKLGPDSRVLDLGAGYGGAARQLARRHGCHVTALNLSETENERNRQMSAAAGLADRITVIDGNFEEIPAEDGTFDVVWSQDAILHSPRRRQVLAEVERVLAPGGHFVFTDPMQADDVPDGVLEPVLARIHLASLASIGFYREALGKLGFREVSVAERTDQLVTHYASVRRELEANRAELADKVSEGYVERMLEGLGHWVKAGRAGHLAWGILHFVKPDA